MSYAAVAALSSTVTYMMCTSRSEQETEELKERIAELESKEHNAIVTQRISEQMEDIAYQQKTISDQQRERAEEQSRIADMERGKAQLEQRLARKAERKAIHSAQQADSMRVVAEHQSELATHHMLEAEASKAKADTLFYNSLGRSLAQTSISQFNSGDTALAALLSYAAWQYTTEYGGNVYQQDVFSSIVKSSGADKKTEEMAKGDIRSVAMLEDGNGRRALIAASNWGEIILMPATMMTPWGTGLESSLQTLVVNKQYDFRDILTDGKGGCLVLDVNGFIAKIEYGANTSCTVGKYVLPADKWMRLMRNGDGSFTAVGKKHVTWLSADLQNVIRTESVEHEITAAGQREDGTIVILCKGGTMLTADNGTQKLSVELPFLKDDIATAYTHFPSKNYDVFGCESGAIYICDTNGEIITMLAGHTGRISHLEHFSRMVMSSSYDNTVRTWDMGNINSMVVSNQQEYAEWPLCFLFDKKTAMLQIGLANGNIHTLCLSVKAAAGHTRDRITREFTPEEWNYYIGKEVEYKTFMK